MTKKHPGRPKPTHVAAYGAALSALALAPQADASSIVALHASPGSVANGTWANVDLLTSGSAMVFSFGQANDSVGKSLISSIYQSQVQATVLFGGQIKPISVSNSLTVGAFGPGGLCFTAGSTGSYGVCFGPGASGTQTFGFKNFSGNLGWFQLNLGGSGNPVTFLAGGYNTVGGDPIHVGSGGSTVPEPATEGLVGLGLLALGATEIRRRRRKLQATQAAP